jgi:FMN phosphatase YigB (HAD superfamily)
MNVNRLTEIFNIEARIIHVDHNYIRAHDRKAAIQDDQVTTLVEMLTFNGITLTEVQLTALQEIAQTNLAGYVSIMNRGFPNSVIVYDEAELTNFIVNRSQEVLAADPEAHLLILDRGLNHILRQKLPASDLKRTHYLSMTRNLDKLYTSGMDGKTPRAGDPSLSEQLDLLKRNVPPNAYLIPVDNSIANTRTIQAVKDFAASQGIAVREDDAIAGVKITRVLGSESDRHYKNTAFLHTRPYLCSEVREAYHGAQFATFDNNSLGLQEPFMLPFSDGAGYSMTRMLHLPEISGQLLQLNINLFEQIGKIIGRPILISDVRRAIPSDRDGRLLRAFAQEFRSSRSKSDDDLYETVKSIMSAPLVEYLAFAKKRILEHYEMPKIHTLCIDIDGTKAELKNRTDNVGFVGSVLHEKVVEKSRLLLGECLFKVTGKMLGQQEIIERLEQIDAEHGLTTYFVHKYRGILEKDFDEGGGAARISQIFADFYGPEEGIKKSRDFMDSMPKAYHQVRLKLWDHDLDEVYPKNDFAKSFMERVKASGARVIDITAAPRIHALKTLTHLGVTSDMIDALYSVEDLFDPDEIPQGYYFERSKGIIFEELINSGIDPINMVMIGDQNHSDITPAQNKGLYTFPVSAPQDLAESLGMMTLFQPPSI